MSALDSDNPFNPFVLRVEVAPEQLAAHGKPPELLMDEAIDEQILALRLREEELEQRRAEFEADVELREERVERWRAELTELKDLLERREHDY